MFEIHQTSPTDKNLFPERCMPAWQPTLSDRKSTAMKMNFQCYTHLFLLQLKLSSAEPEYEGNRNSATIRSNYISLMTSRSVKKA